MDMRAGLFISSMDQETFVLNRTLIKKRLLVKFSCEFPTRYPPLRDLLLVTLLVFVTSGCQNKPLICDVYFYGELKESNEERQVCIVRGECDYVNFSIDYLIRTMCLLSGVLCSIT